MESSKRLIGPSFHETFIRPYYYPVLTHELPQIAKAQPVEPYKGEKLWKEWTDPLRTMGVREASDIVSGIAARKAPDFHGVTSNLPPAGPRVGGINYLA